MELDEEELHIKLSDGIQKYSSTNELEGTTMIGSLDWVRNNLEDIDSAKYASDYEEC